VQLEVKVEAAGEVSSVRPLSGQAGLTAAASEAVRQWRYEPFEKGATLMTITVRFTLDKTKGK
jgi:TonB family protein